MKKIAIKFFGICLTLFGAITSVAIIGIAFLILGQELIDYSTN